MEINVGTAVFQVQVEATFHNRNLYQPINKMECHENFEQTSYVTLDIQNPPNTWWGSVFGTQMLVVQIPP